MSGDGHWGSPGRSRPGPDLDTGDVVADLWGSDADAITVRGDALLSGDAVLERLTALLPTLAGLDDPLPPVTAPPRPPVTTRPLPPAEPGTGEPGPGRRSARRESVRGGSARSRPRRAGVIQVAGVIRVIGLALLAYLLGVAGVLALSAWGQQEDQPVGRVVLTGTPACPVQLLPSGPRAATATEGPCLYVG